MTRSTSRSTLFRAGAVAGAFIMLGALAAEARPSSGGSRGSRTYSAPPPTNTAPTQAQPMNRTVTPAPAPTMGQPGPAMQQPGRPMQSPAGAPAAQSGFRWGALGTGLAAGFLGAGLFGMFTGAGFFSGIGSLMGFLGFLFQAALIAGLIYLVVRLLRGRREANGPAPAHARMGAPLGAGPRPNGGGPIPGMAGGSVQAPAATPTDTVGVAPQDYAAFEDRLKAIMDAWTRQSLSDLRAVATPEMASYFADDLKANEARGVVNRVTDVALLQGDLSEAWREQDSDYATVAMRYSLKDVTVDRATGRVVDGDPRGEEVVEVWTFRRPHGGAWLVSAIQNT